MGKSGSYQIQYWPIFELAANDLIGCCGLRPYKANEYEIGFHLRSEFWGQGYAQESANAVIAYAFTVLKAKKLFAGHNPDNSKSRKVLNKLGFVYIGDEFCTGSDEMNLQPIIDSQLNMLELMILSV